MHTLYRATHVQNEDGSVVLLSATNPRQRNAIAKRLLTPSKEGPMGGATKKVYVHNVLNVRVWWSSCVENRCSNLSIFGQKFAYYYLIKSLRLSFRATHMATMVCEHAMVCLLNSILDCLSRV